MPKVLKPYTIIPPDLYVARDADRQIKIIINDMGRPGYVLVSRQMGKTNLLLNAKRQLETPDDAFVYIDLSNPFENAKSCFENIVDIALETNADRFALAAETIHERRKELRDTPPHKQHTNELRILLKSIPGKLVIILDEIDALTKTQYSDQIFSQIRSIYFSRVNFPELEKLTYILSGVIEPNEIIRDPKISPFNIGQKIFLNDFNKSEFNQFVEKSKLLLPEDVKERIFFWTCGNPRMTWDVCSEVENRKHDEITSLIVDQIVEQLYLTTYDKPPIDNIRELVRNDREIRNAIVEIQSNNSKDVTDKVKNKLYLSGIINYDSNDIRIKNEIIRLALNLDWIKSIEEEDKGLVRIAIEQFEKQKYTDSLRTFEKFLAENAFDETDRSLCYYYMGYASYRIKDFNKAIQYLEKTEFDDEEDKFYYRVINLKGLAYYYNGQIEDSLSNFKTVIESGRTDELYVRSLLNFGSISLKSEKANHKDEAVQIFVGIISESRFNRKKIKPALIDELKSIAHYNLAQLQAESGDAINAVDNYRKAIDLAKLNTKPTMVLGLLEITREADEKYRLLNQLLDLLIEGKIKPAENDPEKPIDFSFNELREILIYSFLIYEETLFEKAKPLLSQLGEHPVAKHLYDLAVYSINNKNWATGVQVLKGLYRYFKDDKYEIDKTIQYSSLKLLSYFTSVSESSGVYSEYINLFIKERLEPVDYLDLEIFANFIFALIEKAKYQQALRYVKVINSYRAIVPESLLINFLVIYHLELNIYSYLREKSKAIKKAEEIIQFANDEKIKQQKSNLLGETGLEVIKQNAESVIRPARTVQKPYVKERSYGRNEIIKVRFKDGTTLETKYKRVEKELNNGECFILE